MSASLRAARLLYPTITPEMFGWVEVERAAALIASEYTPLVKAVRQEIAKCKNCGGKGSWLRAHGGYDPCADCAELRAGLAHIEGDATP